MGFMDKMKKILFDEDEVEIPVSSKELPETKSNVKIEKQGFIDYHHEEENPIKEVIVPKEEKEEEKELPKRHFNFSIDDYEDEPILTREEIEEKEEVTKPIARLDDLDRHYDFEEERKNYHIEEPKKNEYIPKDYKKIISEPIEIKEKKKPFTVTPIISPVYGILDKNYTPEEVKERNNSITSMNTNLSKRDFGPVSYNEPVVKEETIKPVVEIKEEIIDVRIPVEEEKEEIEERIDSIIDDLEQTKELIVDNKYNQSVEDAFEETSEYNRISEFDKSKDEQDNIFEEEVEEEATIGNLDDFEDTVENDPIIPLSVDDDEIGGYTVSTKDTYDDEDDENLDATIETDLFNLIDSMYKSDEDEE